MKLAAKGWLAVATTDYRELTVDSFHSAVYRSGQVGIQNIPHERGESSHALHTNTSSSLMMSGISASADQSSSFNCGQKQ